MGMERFEKLAHELARRDDDLGDALALARDGAKRLRAHAASCIEAFAAAARARGARHLAHIVVGPVEPDEKHVDCIQFVVSRGRWQIACVAKARGAVGLVGPFQRGKAEKPCTDHALAGEEVESALEDLLIALVQAASER